MSAEGDVPCFISTIRARKLGINGRKAFVPAREYKKFWKVITPEAAGKGGDGFSKMFIGTPEDIHSWSYISFEVGSEREAHSLVSYLETDIVNEILAIRKNTQHISNKTVSFIPLVPLDRTWTDASVRLFLGI